MTGEQKRYDDVIPFLSGFAAKAKPESCRAGGAGVLHRRAAASVLPERCLAAGACVCGRAARRQSIGSKSLAGCLQSGQMKSAGSVSPS